VAKKNQVFMPEEAQKGTYLIIDLEMTGLNPFMNGVVEV
jgi:oligoribonuclease (3'-5' exoribonuclease)